MGAKALNADKPFLSGYDVNARFAAILTVFVVLVAVLIFAVFNSTVPGMMRVIGGENEVTITTLSQSTANGESLQPISKLIGMECSEFGKYVVECENSIGLVLGEYSGNISTIERIEDGDRFDIGSFWLIGINLDNELMLGDKGAAMKIKAMVASDNRVSLYEVFG